MTRLSPAQTDLLTAAACADGGAIDASEDTAATTARLIKRGFLISMPRAEGPSRLLITDAGRAAIGAPERPELPPQAVDEPAPEAPAPAEPVANAPPEPRGKTGTLVCLLRRAQGATVEDMMTATGWQAHSVRGAISGAIKKGLGLDVLSEKTDAGRVYRITAMGNA